MSEPNGQTDLPTVQPANGSAADDSTLVISQTPQPQPAQQPTILNLPQEAEDLDLIEKEWVLKAKQIVERTIEDPYTQQAEISKMKADYMKKRYDKNIKVTED